MSIDDPGPEPSSPLDLNLTTADLAGPTPEGAASETRSFRDEDPAKVQANAQSQTALFPAGEAGDLRGRWDAIQAGFVDEPRRAVEQADGLVAGAMKRLAEIFAAERATLEGQWDRGDDVTTEDLRVALQRYRSFFGRLLSM